VWCQAEDVGQVLLHEVRNLRPSPARKCVEALVVFRRHAAGLDRHTCIALDVERLPKTMLGLSEDPLRFANGVIEGDRDVVIPLAMHAWRVRRARAENVHNGGLWLVLDLYRVNTSIGCRGALGYHDRQTLARVSRDVVDQWELSGTVHGHDHTFAEHRRDRTERR
jgi:hypothetical protein